MGSVFQGQPLRFDFTLANPTPTAIKIKEIHIECDCIRLEKNIPQIIPPNTEQPLVILFDATYFAGYVKKTIWIESEELQAPILKLAVSGNIKYTVKLSPPILFLNSNKKQRLIRHVYLSYAPTLNNSPYTPLFPQITVPNPAITYNIKQQSTHQYQVSLNFESLKEQQIEAQILIHTHSGLDPAKLLVIKDTSHLQKSFNQAIDFGVVKDNKPQEKRIILPKNKTDPLALTFRQILVNENGTFIPNIRLKPFVSYYLTHNSQQTVLHIKLSKPKKARKESISGKLIFETTNTEQEININFYAFFDE